MFKYRVNNMTCFVALLVIFTTNRANSQNLILNGSFEINNMQTTSSCSQQSEISNTQFNDLVSYCYSIGTFSYLDLASNLQCNDIPLPQHGDWYVGIQSIIEQFSMELSDSLEIGSTYQFSFYASGFLKICPAPVEIGISMYNNDFGTLIYASSTPSDTEWNLMLTSFIPSIKAKYITVRTRKCSDGWSTGWTAVDNFCLSKGEQCIELPEFEMPNVFTPNDDGVNDVFKPVVYKGMKTGKLTILNRWGGVIFETDDLTQGWNGIVDDKPVSEGVYFWTVEYTTIFDEIRTEHGFLSVLR